MEAQNFIETITKITAKEWQDEQKNFLIYCIKSADSALYSQVYRLCGIDPFDGSERMAGMFRQMAARCTMQALKRVDDYNMKSLAADNSEGIRKWLNDNEAELGPYVLKKCLHFRNMDGYYEDKQAWNEILNTLTGDTYILGNLVAMLSASQDLPQRIAGAVESYNKEDGQRVRRAWENCRKAPELAALMGKPAKWFSPYSSDIEGFIGNFERDVKEACRRTDRNEIYTDENLIWVGELGFAVYDLVTYRRDFHGETIIAWLKNSDEVKHLGIFTGADINNVTVTEVNRETKQSGCVIEDTPILLADGTVKKIQDIKSGDLLVNGAGAISCCSGELVKTKYIRYFYSINGGSPIFSLEHAILTEEGWKSPDPEAANSINSSYNVTKLKEGDCFFKGNISEDGEIIYTKERIENIKITKFAEGRTGYDLHFSEGYHSYCADGIVCLLNYPEMTIHRITENIKSNMNLQEKEAFIQIFYKYQELFEKAIGYTAAEKLMEAMIEKR